jgi:hypothetical protein
MNQSVLKFFSQHYAPGRVCLIGSANPLYKLIRDGQSRLTKDGKPSRYNHTFLMGVQRQDGRDDGGLYIFESDIHVSVKEWEVRNGVMESRLTKWCLDDLEYAAVLGLELTDREADALIQRALWYAYDEEHLIYPIGELFGTLWAILTGKLSKRNVFDDAHAVQCATFVRMCYRDIQREIVSSETDLTNTSPEVISQSPVFTFRQEWKKG